MSQSDLRKVARAAREVAKAQDSLRQAILIARDGGETLSDIGSAAGLTRQRVHQIVGKRSP